MAGSWCWLSVVVVRGPGSPSYSFSTWLIYTIWQLNSKSGIEASSLKAWAEWSQNVVLLCSAHQSSPRLFLELKEGKINSTSQGEKGTRRGELVISSLESIYHARVMRSFISFSQECYRCRRHILLINLFTYSLSAFYWASTLCWALF